MKIKRLLLKLAISYVRHICKMQPYCDGCLMYDSCADECCFFTDSPRTVDLPEWRK